jgi:hypothetical protein
MSTCNNILTHIYDCLYDSRLIVLDVLDAVNILCAQMSNQKSQSVAKNVAHPIIRTSWQAVREMNE